jgi:hypothetical protein
VFPFFFLCHIPCHSGFYLFITFPICIVNISTALTRRFGILKGALFEYLLGTAYGLASVHEV